MAPRITMDELMRAFGRPMAPVQEVRDMPIGMLPQPQPMQQSAPAPQQAETQRRGLLGFLGDRDARARLAIALEGMTLNPNQAYMQMLQEGVATRQQTKAATEAKNKTAAWLRSQGRDDLAAAVEAGVMSGRDAAQVAMAPRQEQQAPASFVALDMQARAAGLQPGTPEYQQFMRTGGGAVGDATPAAFVAMDMQARAAGFEPGTPEYKEFMATRGAGLAAEARVTGEARGTAIAGAPTDIAQADTTLQYIDELRKHPGREFATGTSSAFNVIPGTPGYDFQNRVDQLKSGAFLTAIDQLRGMGALSNAEGQTATAAITRMDTATSEPEFLAALDDYERIVKLGRDRAAARLPNTEQPPAQGGVARISSDAEYEALPSGAMFIGPDGKTRRKP